MAALGMSGAVTVVAFCLIGTSVVVYGSLALVRLAGLDPVTIYGGQVAILAFVAAALWPGLVARMPRLDRLFSRRPVAQPEPQQGFLLGDLKAMITRYHGTRRTCQAFETYAASRDLPLDLARPLDAEDLKFGETQLAASIGISSSRLVISLLYKKQSMSRDEILQLVDDVSNALHDRSDLLHEVVAASRNGIALYDRQLRILAWQTGPIKIFHFEEGEIQVGMRLEDLVRRCAKRGYYGAGPVEDLVTARLAAILDTTTVKRTRLNDGKVIDLRTIRLPDGAFCMIYMDVTEQTEAEKQLEAENETLERRVRKRTEELEGLIAALAKAKGEAEEANISKTRFLAAASHDLLQPLNAARLYATSLKERVQAREAVDDSLMLALNVEDSLEALEDILTALLDMSRLDAGAMKTEISAFRIDDLFRQLRLEFEPIAEGKGLALSFVPSTLVIASDRRLLGRLLQNLVSNAIKYTIEGRVIVGVRRDQGHAEIQVWDTGLGIPKARHGDIFREFERLPSAVRTAPGLGLGLSIVQRIGRVLDHEIRIRSKPGRGSVFSILVPRVLEPQAIPFAVASPRQRSLDGLVVAAIDNEPAILRGMEALLGGWACTVVTGLDAESALAALQARDLMPDVLIADYHLDKGDGIAAIAMLRERYGLCQAVLVTADQSLAVRDLALRADIRLLNKPVKPAALRALLSQWRLLKQTE